MASTSTPTSARSKSNPKPVRAKAQAKKGKKPPPPAPVAPEDDEYEVERICEHRISEKDPEKYEYLIKWKNYSDDDNTFEPVEALTDCRLAFHSYWDQVLRNRLYKNAAAKKFDEEVVPRLAKLGLDVTDIICTQIQSPHSTQQNKLTPAMSIVVQINQEVFAAEHQRALHRYVIRLNKICVQFGETPLLLENDVDFELPPHDLDYIVQRKAGTNVCILDEPFEYCSCAADPDHPHTCGTQNTCCPRLRAQDCEHENNEAAYEWDKHKTTKLMVFRQRLRSPIYECNKKCACTAACLNRVVQNGRQLSVCIYRTLKSGWGVKACVDIQKGTFITEYVGEVITDAEAETRDSTYILDLDYANEDGPFAIDAEQSGNVARFINHSCDPNLTQRVVYVDCQNHDFPHLALFALRDIVNGEPLTFNYQPTYKKGSGGPVKRRRLKGAQPSEPSDPNTSTDSAVNDDGSIKCHCGAEQCQDYIWLGKKTSHTDLID